MNLEAERLANLRKGDVIRCRRARLKEAMREGGPSLAEVLMADKQWMARMQVRHVLMAVPGLGAQKVRRALTANRIGWYLTLENFPMKRRMELLCWLRANYPSIPIGELKGG